MDLIQTLQLRYDMNERIRELWEQAAKTTQGDSWEEQTKFTEKFAQLIVRECAKEAFKYTWNEENYQHYNDNGWDCLPGDLKSHIEEHFGVEE
jgi:hypothetical protein